MNSARKKILVIGLLLVFLGAYLAFQFLLPSVLGWFGVNPNTPVNQLGSKLILVLAAPPLFIILGAAAGWLLLPVFTRPFINSKLFWQWLSSEKSIYVPLYSKLFNRIAKGVYGPPS
jgi:hypothetical protein